MQFIKRNSRFLVALAALIVGITGLVVIGYSLSLSISDADQAKDISLVAQSLVTTIAIIIGGIYTVVKLDLSRYFAPHVAITQIVTHRVIGDSYVHLLVTTTIHNSSKIKIDFCRGYFQCQIISPITDEIIESMTTDVVKKNHRGIQWPIHKEVMCDWSENYLRIESGESHQETCEFIIRKGVKSVLIHTYFRNLRKHPDIEGWGATTVYDIILHH